MGSGETMNDPLLDGCLITLEQTRDELEDIERRLARRHGIDGSAGDVRQTLIDMIRSGAIVEDELVADWHGAYCSYLDWMANPTAPDTNAEKPRQP